MGAMAGSYELVWRSDGVERALPIHRVVTVGRGPENDLVLPGEQVSYQHARLWIEDGAVWIVDTGSTNGTLVGTTRINARTQVEPGTIVRIGVYQLDIRPIERTEVGAGRWVLEDLSTGVRLPLGGHFVIGSGPKAQLRIEGVEASLVRTPTGYDRVYADGDTTQIIADTPFRVGPLTLQLMPIGDEQHRNTLRPFFSNDCYHIDATLDARTPWAKISDDKDNSLVIEGEARATLVFVLARAVLADRERGSAPMDEGWMDDLDVAREIWGRSGQAGFGNKLSVVVYRLRADLKKVGLEDSFVERKRGRIRVRAARVSLTD